MTTADSGALIAAWSPMFGRDAEVDHLRDLLRSPLVRLVSLTGRGGVGKTRLAVEFAAIMVDLGVPTTVVALAGVSAADHVLGEIAPALGVTSVANADISDTVVAYLSDDDHLLVLDNFEHLLEAAPVLGELLDRCPGLRILVTTQAPLHLRSERVVAVAPFPIPSPGEDLAVLAEEPAVATYAERASAVDRHFELSAENAPAVVELCRRLEGLPLAIELAAARAVTLPAAEILRRLDDSGLDLLQRTRADAPERHHELRAAIAWTYERLSPSQQRQLRRISVFSGTFDIDAAIALDHVGGNDDSSLQVLDQLTTLVDFHLVDPIADTDPIRFVIPSSIRAFAAAELEASGEADEVRLRHRTFRACQARRVADVDGIASGTDEGLVHRLEADHDDINAVLLGALDAEAGVVALDVVGGLAVVWDARGYHRAQEVLLERALALGARQGADAARMVGALVASAELGLRHRSDLESEALVARLQQAEVLARANNDDDQLLRVLSAWMLVAPSTGDVGRAALAIGEGLQLAARPANDHWLRHIQVWAGMFAHLIGDDPRAVELGTAALDAARRHGDRATIVRAAMLLEPLRDRHPEQLAQVPSNAETLELARSVGMPFYEALLLPRLVGDTARTGDLEASARWAVDTLNMSRSMPGSTIVGFHLMALALFASARGDHDRVAHFHGVIRSRLPELERMLAADQMERFTSAVETSLAEIGTSAFDTEADLGAERSWAEGVQVALSYVQATITSVTTPDPPAAQLGTDSGAEKLTVRQLEVVRLLAHGLSNKEVAAQLKITPKSVMHHTTAIYQAIGVRGRSEATAWAFRTGVVG